MYIRHDFKQDGQRKGLACGHERLTFFFFAGWVRGRRSQPSHPALGGGPGALGGAPGHCHGQTGGSLRRRRRERKVCSRGRERSRAVRPSQFTPLALTNRNEKEALPDRGCPRYVLFPSTVCPIISFKVTKNHLKLILFEGHFFLNILSMYWSRWLTIFFMSHSHHTFSLYTESIIGLSTHARITKNRRRGLINLMFPVQTLSWWRLRL